MPENRTSTVKYQNYDINQDNPIHSTNYMKYCISLSRKTLKITVSSDVIDVHCTRNYNEKESEQINKILQTMVHCCYLLSL